MLFTVSSPPPPQQQQQPHWKLGEMQTLRPHPWAQNLKPRDVGAFSQTFHSYLYLFQWTSWNSACIFFFLVYEENWLVCGIVFLLCVASSSRTKEKTHLSLNCVGTSVKSTQVSFKSLLSLLYASVSSCISPSVASCPLPVLQFRSITSDHQGRFWALSATWIWKGLSWRPVAHAENYNKNLNVLRIPVLRTAQWLLH